MRCRSILVLSGLVVLLLAGSPGRISSTSQRQERIAGPIAASPVVWLEGNRRPMFRPENDQGPVAESFRLENIALYFKPTEDQQANLAALLEQQQDPSSPLYHHWLTPEQFADAYGLSPSDLAKAVAWLQSQGFAVTQIARSRNWVSFSGTAAQVRSALHTEIHHYSLEGETFYANSSEPALPASLAEVALGFTGLDNYRLKPHSVFRAVPAPGPAPAALQSGATDTPEPEFTSYISGSHFLAPGDFAIIYDLNALYSNGIDGTGQSIAIMGQTDLYDDGSGPASDVTKFRSVSGLPAIAPQIILVPGVSDPGVSSNDINEASLDVEWAGAVAPKATIIYVNGGTNGVYSNALPYAVDNNLAPVISISYGLCEQHWTSVQRNAVQSLAGQANSQGQTIVVASGDSGAADCDYSSSTNLVLSAQNGLAVDFPASSPLVTAMGGTRFNEGSGVYWTPATGSTDVSPSALSYIPEIAWNDTSSSSGLQAGGGGVSVYYSKPSWQTGPGVPSDGFRDVPDVSLNASSLHDGYLICAQGGCVNGYRDPNNATLPNALTVAGGTSAGAPTFAGIVALINQKTGSSQGNVNPTLYSMASTSPAAFHDITAGDNKVPCTAGTIDCPNGGTIGYAAGAGYDQATGLGSIDAYNLVMAWGAAGTGNLPAPTLTAPANGLAGVSLTPTFSWTAVTGAAGYRIMVATSPALLPTDPAVASCSGCAINDTTTAASYVPAAALAAHTVYYWQVQAIPPSSSSGVAAWSSVSVFNTGSPDFSLSVSPSTLALSRGSSGTSTLTLTPVDSFSTASVTFSCAVSSSLTGVTCAVGSLGVNNTATVTVTASSSAAAYPLRNPRFGGWPLAVAALLGLLWIALRRLRSGSVHPSAWGWRRVALGGILAMLLAAGLSCGGGGSPITPSTPAPQSGTVTVTGTSTYATHSVQISVTVS